MTSLAKARPVAPGYKADPRTVARLARAYGTIARAFVDEKAWDDIRDAVERRDPSGVLAALPKLNDQTPEGRERIQRLVRAFMAVLGEVFEQAANGEYKRVGSDIRARVRKADDPMDPEMQMDAARALRALQEGAHANRFTQVPHGANYLRQRAAELVVDIGQTQMDALRTVIASRWDPDVRPEAFLRDIKWVVGLTDNEAASVLRREDLMRQNGLDDDRVRRETEKYADKLHNLRAERIARTETVFAEAEGKQTAWEVARDDGTVPKGAGKEWVSSSNCCDDCAKLDGVIVPLDGTWQSTNSSRKRTGGRVKNPPLHPNCECMPVLIADWNGGK